MATIAGSGVLYSLLNPRYGTGFLNDDAIYVITAHDFWKTALRHPLLGIKPDYPLPGLPLFLAPFAKLVAPHWSVLEWICVAMATVTSFVVGKLLERWLSRGQTLFALFLYAFNPVVARFASTVMPSHFFTLAAAGSLLLMGRSLDEPSAVKTLALGFIVGWGSTLRPEAAVLAGAVIVALAGSSRGRRLLPLLVLPLLAWAGFVWLWFQTRQAPRTEFGGDLHALLAYWPGHVGDAVPFFLDSINIVIVETWGFIRDLSPDSADLLCRIVAVIFLVGIGVGSRSLWRRRAGDRPVFMAAGLFCAAYSLVHVFWHVLEPRYVIPVLPFAFAAAVPGAANGVQPFSNRKILLLFAALAIVVPTLYRDGRSVYHALAAPEEKYSPPWRSLSWLHDHSAAEDTVTSNIPSSVDLYAGRNSMGILTVDNGDEFTYLVLRQHLDFIVLRDVTSVAPGVGIVEDPNLVVDQYRRWMHFYPHRFPVLFSDASEATTICRISAPPNFQAAYDRYIAAAEATSAGRYDQALQSINECLALCPLMGCAENLRGSILFLRQNSAEAERAFLKARDLSPDSSNVLLNLASVYHQRQDEARAAELLKQAADLSRTAWNEREFRQNSETLRNLWKSGRTTLFIKLPHTSLYNQIKE